MGKNYIFTSESVGEGHPDKLCDQISDSILDEAIKLEPKSRVAIESFASNGVIFVGGEMTIKNGYIDIQKTVRNVVKKIGYDNPKFGLDHESCGVIVNINEQSGDIAMGVDSSENKEQGAGDQGIMFGYATDETDVYMPMPIYYSHKLMEYLSKVRKRGDVDYLRPDSKSQVSVYYENDIPKYITSVLISTQHSDEVESKVLKEFIIEDVMKKVIPAELLAKDVQYLVNPTGRFVKGGPAADTGLTGRKIIVDTYGGMGRHGGGAFSGKDPSKVDRSGAYMMRYVAKNLVAAKLAKKIELQVSYAIGIAEPISIMVNSFGTGVLSDERLEEIVRKEFSFKPRNIIEKLDLLKPIYLKTAAYGHFGRECAEFKWESLDKVDDLKKYLP